MPKYNIVFRATKEQGRVKLKNPRLYDMYLSTFKEGVELDVIVKRHHKKNSRQEQNYYRGVVVSEIAAELGETEERTHQILQPQFFLYHDEKGRPYIRSTELGGWETVEWEEKMEEIRRWAEEFFSTPENPAGLRIPLPNEVDF